MTDLVIEEFNRNRERIEQSINALAYEMPLVGAMATRNFRDILELLNGGRTLEPTGAEREGCAPTGARQAGALPSPQEQRRRRDARRAIRDRDPRGRRGDLLLRHVELGRLLRGEGRPAVVDGGKSSHGWADSEADAWWFVKEALNRPYRGTHYRGPRGLFSLPPE